MEKLYKHCSVLLPTAKKKIIHPIIEKLDDSFNHYTDEDWQKEMNVTHLLQERDWKKEAFYQISLLYNFISTACSTHLKWWNQIIQVGDAKLILGAIPLRGSGKKSSDDLENLIKEGVEAIVTIVEPFELHTSNITSRPISPEQWKKAGLHHLHIPSADLYPLTIRDLCKGVEFIQWNLSKGKSVYVHCKAGKGRSVLVIICYLIKYQHMTAEEALKTIRKKRPQINPNASQVSLSQVFEKLCHRHTNQ